MNWNQPETPPAMIGPGIPSEPVLVLLDTGETISAEFWQSTSEGQPPKWYISKTVYEYPEPYREICETVVGWKKIIEWVKFEKPYETIIAIRTAEIAGDG